MKNKTILAVGAIGALSVISLIAMANTSKQIVSTKTGPGFSRTEEVSESMSNGHKQIKKRVTTRTSEQEKLDAKQKREKQNLDRKQEKERMKQEREKRHNSKYACPCRPSTPKSSETLTTACGCKPKTNVNSMLACGCRPQPKTNVNNVVACGCNNKPKTAPVSQA